MAQRNMIADTIAKLEAAGVVNNAAPKPKPTRSTSPKTKVPAKPKSSKTTRSKKAVLQSLVERKSGATMQTMVEANIREPRVDRQLIDRLRQAHRWWSMLVAGKAFSIARLASDERVDASEISRTVTLAFLAASIARVIRKGTQPQSLTLDTLRRARPLPADWKQQRRPLGC